MDSATPPGRTLRFRVQDGSGTSESSTWNVVTIKKTGDVYVGSRDVMAELKLSLHESGIFRMAWTTEEAPQRVANGADRMIEAWSLPEERAPGWRLVLRIDFPTSALSPILPPLRPRKKTETIPAAGLGQVCVVRIFVAEQGAPDVTFDGDPAGIVGEMQLGDGRKLVVIAWHHNTSAEIEELVKQIHAQAVALGEDVRPTPRCFGWGSDPESGAPYLIDAGDPRPASARTAPEAAYDGKAAVTVAPLVPAPRSAR